jgi:type I restriction enzyme M protein
LLEDYEHQQVLSHPDVDLIAFARAHYDEKPLRRVDQTIRGTQRGLKTSFIVRLSETQDRIDPPFYLLQYQAGTMLASFESLRGEISKGGERFRPETDDEKDKEYPILSVTNDGKVSLNEYIRGEDFTQSYKRVKVGDIVYNPYRVNIGSIGVVSKEWDGAYASPAYVVFRSKHHDPQFLVNLMRSPFYKLYIDVISTGSIRDSLSYDLLETLRIPKVNDKRQEEINKDLNTVEKKIEELLHEIDESKEVIIDKMHTLLG